MYLLPKGVCWNTVRYMLGEVQYGGRVTDDYDKRLLNTYCKVWLGEHMFPDSFCFYKGYSIPHCKTVEQYREAIDNMPLVDTPQVSTGRCIYNMDRLRANLHLPSLYTAHSADILFTQ